MPDRSFIAGAESAVMRARNAVVVDMRYFTANTEIAGPPNSSRTVLKYDTSGQLSIPRLVFVLTDDAPVPSKFQRLRLPRAQKAFRHRLCHS
jgi:hypothetical protein